MSRLRYLVGPRSRLYVGDALEVMRSIDDCTYDSVLTDPPYGIDFMGKGWDVGVPPRAHWKEALRIAKPGAHLVAFGGTRTYHRLATMIEDAGWELRDCLAWFYRSGFPKSHNVAKEMGRRFVSHRLSEKWRGWGTALKPAWEPIILARKPLEGPVSENVFVYGTGALNIDATRGEDPEGAGTVCTNRDENGRCLGHKNAGRSTAGETFHGPETQPTGRWPTNLAFDEYAAGYHDAAYGPGTASRFFYVVKPSRAEKERGLDDFAARGRDATRTEDQASMHGGAGNPYNRGAKKVLNVHATVKPSALMQRLATLITPPRGRILDPYVGSGTTPLAAVRDWFDCDGIDVNSTYIKIARARVLSEQAFTGVHVRVYSREL